MNGRITIVLIALIGIGLYALPQTMALFAGQHSFVNIDPTGNQVECDKCHGDVNAELIGSTNELTGTKAPHADMECSFCHRLQIGQSSGDNAYAVVEYEGNAINSTSLLAEKVTRYYVISVTDYERQAYPLTIPANATKIVGSQLRQLPGIVLTGNSLTSTVGSLSGFPTGFVADNTAPAWTLRVRLNGGTYNFPGNFTNQTTINGTRGTIFPLYDYLAAADNKPRDQNTTTRFGGFTPAKVTFNAFPKSFPSGSTIDNYVNLNQSGSRVVNSGSRYHAASLVACMDCHAGASPQPGHETARLGQTTTGDEQFCEKCHYGSEEPGQLRATALSAGGFGMGLTNENFDDGSAEVHKPMVTADAAAIGYKGGQFTQVNNAGCIGCHTHVDVEISYARPTTMTYDANEISGTWGVDNFGSDVNITYNPGNTGISVGGVSTG